MLPRKEVLSGLLGTLYDAATDPARWKIFLRSVALAFRGEASAIIMHHSEGEIAFLNYHWELDPECPDLWLKYYCRRDPWAAKGLAIKTTEWAGTSECLVPFSEFVRTEYYNDFARRFRIPHALFARIENSATHAVHLGIYRDHARGEFHERDIELLTFLVPHLRRAHQIHLKLTKNESHTRSMEAALNQISCGVILLGDAGTLIFANRAAEAILGRNDGLTCFHGRLQASVLNESEELRRLISEAASTSIGDGVRLGGSLRVSRHSGSPLVLLISPVGALPFEILGRAAVMVFITDPDQRVRPPRELLQSLFGLSPAESRLAALLADGRSTAEISDLLGVSLNTVKSQLASIFRKTGTSRQAQVVKLLSVLPGR